jgi:O-acetyl-ADP-ribose deacetylase
MNATDELLGWIRVVQGDITQMPVDAIVNAANQGLIGGGGVDGAIHRAAGPELMVACRAVAPCPTGQARITRGFRLQARYVIHTAGPVYGDGQQGEPELLESCYNSALRLAQENQIEHVAFPCISTGIYGFPQEQACWIAIAATQSWLREHRLPWNVTFCCFLNDDLELYRARLDRLGLLSK